MSPHAAHYRLLPTEQPNPRTRDIDLLATYEALRRINREDGLVAQAVARELRSIARLADAIAAAFASGARLIFVGAGTSGRLGVLEAAECPPTFGTPASLVQAVMAGGRSAVFRPKEGAEDDERAGARETARRARRGDVVVGIAASGVTPFVRAALREASRKGCRTALITSNSRPHIRHAEVVISPRVGPEVLAGSTRLKSATAAKLVLNMLTTAAMIRCGKVYDHWMVDLKPTSRKLELRAVRIVCDLGGVTPPRAKALLKSCGASAKVAVLCAKTALSPSEARRLLRIAGGSLRKALA